MSSSVPSFAGNRDQCARCGTELAPHALACPACGALVHADKLKQLAAAANAAVAVDELVRAREQWETALRYLPPESQQHTIIRGRIAELTQRIDGSTAAPGTKPAAEGSWFRRGGAAILSVALLLVGKLKFLLLGLTKASTFVSMFAFFAVYWNIFGWPLALGLVVSIYIHEMGHVAMLRRRGIAAGAPQVIPGVVRRLRRDRQADLDRDRASDVIPQPVQPDPGLAARRLARLSRALAGRAMDRRGDDRGRALPDGAATAVHRGRRRGVARRAARGWTGRSTRARDVRDTRGGAVVDREGRRLSRCHSERSAVRREVEESLASR